MDIHNVPMVRVTWLEARGTETGGIEIKDIIAAPCATCQEGGWRTGNNDEKIVIMRSWCVDRDDNHGGGAIAIPKGLVKKIEYLRVTHADVRD